MRSGALCKKNTKHRNYDGAALLQTVRNQMIFKGIDIQTTVDCIAIKPLNM
jgi:hypothetical protein